MGVSVGIGGMGMGGESMGDKLTALAQTLPPWLAALLGTLAVLAAAALVGWLGGKLVGNFLYPDPEKPSVLTRWQKLTVFCAIVAACGLLGYNLHKTLAPPEPEDTLAVGADGMADGFTPAGDLLMGEPAEGTDGDGAGGEEAGQDEATGEAEGADNGTGEAEGADEGTGEAASADEGTAGESTPAQEEGSAVAVPAETPAA